MRVEQELIFADDDAFLAMTVRHISRKGKIGVISLQNTDADEFLEKVDGAWIAATPFDEDFFFPTQQIDAVCRLLKTNRENNIFLYIMNVERQMFEFDSSDYSSTARHGDEIWGFHVEPRDHLVSHLTYQTENQPLRVSLALGKCSMMEIFFANHMEENFSIERKKGEEKIFQLVNAILGEETDYSTEHF